MEKDDLKNIKAKYKPRLIDELIASSLPLSGALLIKGPKWCGKTWTGAYFSNDVIEFQDEKIGRANKELALLNPAELLDKEKPLLIDEWQEVESIWDAVRKKVDKNSEQNKYILTGSITPNYLNRDKENKKLHSGAGRIKQISMSTLTFNEIFHKNKISFKNTVNGIIDKNNYVGKLELRELISFTIKGGWPHLVEFSTENARFILEGYIDSLCGDDILKYRNVRLNSNIIKKIILSWSRNVCTYVDYVTVYNDVLNFLDKKVSLQTFKTYIQIFTDMFIFDEIKPWLPNLRSKTRLRGISKKIFTDPSLGCACIKATVDGFLNDLNYYGFFFENTVFKDLKVYASILGYEVFQYRDNANLEIDAIIEIDNLDYLAIEIKLGTNKIDEAIENFKRFKKKMENGGYKQPKYCIVIVGVGGIYQIKEDVIIIPYDLLGF